MQGAIGACGLAGFVVGQFLFSQLFVHLPEGTKWIVFVLGVAVSGVACGLVLKLWRVSGGAGVGRGLWGARVAV